LVQLEVGQSQAFAAVAARYRLLGECDEISVEQAAGHSRVSVENGDSHGRHLP